MRREAIKINVKHCFTIPGQSYSDFDIAVIYNRFPSFRVPDINVIDCSLETIAVARTVVPTHKYLALPYILVNLICI